jgi:hypothetical protein
MINIILFPSLADAGYLSTVTVQHTVFNDTCNSTSLECQINIQQSPGTRPQSLSLLPRLPRQSPQYIGKFEIHWRNDKFSVIKTIIIYIYVFKLNC